MIFLAEALPFKVMLVNSLNQISQGGVIAVRLFLILLSVRFGLDWFPSINPFIQPFFLLRVLTDPYIELFNNFFPIILGIDLSVIASFVFLEWVILTLQSVHFSV